MYISHVVLRFRRNRKISCRTILVEIRIARKFQLFLESHRTSGVDVHIIATENIDVEMEGRDYFTMYKIQISFGFDIPSRQFSDRT